MAQPDVLDLDGYLTRVGYRGPLRADAGVLAALHTVHVGTIPFENVDVGFGGDGPLSPVDFGGAVAKQGGDAYRVVGEGRERVLQLGREGGGRTSTPSPSTRRCRSTSRSPITSPRPTPPRRSSGPSPPSSACRTSAASCATGPTACAAAGG